jgi:Domain of unknown function (DUF4864)
MIRTLLIIATFALGLAGATRADDLSEADRGVIDTIIADQIAAFRSDDGATAYGFASPMIQQIFPSADAFMAMVRKGYPQVYRPQRYSFSRLTTTPSGLPAQHVIILGPDGKTYEAVYTMQRQPDGSWKINGCQITELAGVSA